MYTQCPNCKTLFRVDIEKLRSARGEVLCQKCHVIFNALNSLAEDMREVSHRNAQSPRTPVAGKQEASGSPRYEPALGAKGTPDDLPSLRAGTRNARPRHPSPWSEDRDEPPPLPRSSGPGWWIGTLSMLALLVWQVSIFEGERLVQSERLRPWLELACESFACDLPPYKDTSRIQVVDRALLPAPDDIDGYEFSVILSNQSSLAQAFPLIKLVLLELNGRAVASRIFAPEEYLDATRPAKMPVGKPFEIRLLLAKPSSEVGGFSFDLL